MQFRQTFLSNLLACLNVKQIQKIISCLLPLFVQTLDTTQKKWSTHFSIIWTTKERWRWYLNEQPTQSTFHHKYDYGLGTTFKRWASIVLIFETLNQRYKTIRYYSRTTIYLRHMTRSFKYCLLFSTACGFSWTTRSLMWKMNNWLRSSHQRRTQLSTIIALHLQRLGCVQINTWTKEPGMLDSKSVSQNSTCICF